MSSTVMTECERTGSTARAFTSSIDIFDNELPEDGGVWILRSLNCLQIISMSQSVPLQDRVLTV
jgi:hypothetical protein